jgi:rRNA maturation endonuclease Nob1
MITENQYIKENREWMVECPNCKSKTLEKREEGDYCWSCDYVRED